MKRQDKRNPVRFLTARNAISDRVRSLDSGANDYLIKPFSFETERQFTSDASHELRTPMSVIQAQCELLLQKQRSPQEYEAALQAYQQAKGLAADAPALERHGKSGSGYKK